jgi:hypothetical protein
MSDPGNDTFLSEEDLDLENLSGDELAAVYQAWLVAASSTNDEDRHLYSHGVFLAEPGFAHLVPELQQAPFSPPAI